MSILRRLGAAFRNAPSTNYPLGKTDPYALLPRDAVLFDIGSKQSGARYQFGAPPADAKVVCVDIREAPGVDLVADAHDMHMVPDNSVDAVVTISVLEHVNNPWKVMEEIHRILKPGGIVYVSVPFIFPFHADPDDYWRFSHKGLEVLCERFDRVDGGFNRGPASTMCHLLVHFLAIALSFNVDKLYGFNRIFFTWCLFWLKYLDAVIGRFGTAYIIHTGAFFLGRKPEA
ncbi:MAG: class I SAM-dependent methyltransferase [Alphaproteobacteria bacterium]|nr:class I SAM-dependent methyltransferase [Alphaproteobacteria bacterium]MDX5369299.1 class I SAM-dependent methyltransferase [Alphaproteobacteria bacterium]MDX5463984.1 class I SAM-dependent methyltransferase [Alphaproteobacteria bacterium]